MTVVADAPTTTAPSASPAVVVDHVTKAFRLYHERNQSLKASIMNGRRAKFEELTALDDVSLTIPKGITYGLVGHNGSGKSTLLKCLARILNPDTGSVHVEGKVSALLELGSGFHPELSGRDNVFMNGSILGLSKKELQGKFDEIVEFAGLQDRIDTPVKNYSSGMYIRLGFSVAINVNPDVLLVDEVLAVGDEEFQRRCDEKFADLKASGKTIVIVSHALDAVRDLCDQVAWLEHGKLQLIGKPGPVIGEYLGKVHRDSREAAAARARAATGVPKPDESIEQLTDEADPEYADAIILEGPPPGDRWGSGEVTVDAIEMLGADGVATTTLRSGDPVTFRIHWTAHEPVTDPTFGIDIHRLDGVHITGPNTKEHGLAVGEVTGAGTTDLTVERLPLLPGTFHIGAWVDDSTSFRPLDRRWRLRRFDVVPGAVEERWGITSLGGSWNVH